MTQYSHYEAASINVKGALERLTAIPGGLIPTHQLTGEAAIVQATAACAIAQGILAIAESLNNPPRPAGACPSYLRTGFPADHTHDERILCRHPDGHTGLHSNDPAKTRTGELEARWTDTASGAARLDEEQP